MTELITHEFYICTDASTDTWVDITSDVLLQGTRLSKGMQSSAPLDRIASVGQLRIVLKNDGTSGTAFRYTPGHPNCIPGFGVKCALKVITTWSAGEVTKCIWKGWIPPSGIIQPSGALSAQLVQVIAYDWMWFAVNFPVTLASIATDQTLGNVAASLIAMSNAQPSRIDLKNFSETFPSAFDTIREKTTIYTELYKAIISEMGYAYITYQPNCDDQDILVIEGRTDRDNTTLHNFRVLPSAESAEVWTDARDQITDEAGNILLANQLEGYSYIQGILDFRIEHGANFFSKVSGKAYPRKVGSANTLLFSLEEPVYIEAGTALENLRIRYLNPDSNYPDITATDVEVRSKAMYSNSDGTGSDLSANLTVTLTVGAADSFIDLENTGLVGGWITDLQIEGTPVLISNPVIQVVEVEDSASELYGVLEVELDQKYQADPRRTFDQITLMVVRYSERTNTIEEIMYCANKSTQLADLFMWCDVGSKIPIQDSQGLVSENYIIQGIEMAMDGTATMVHLYLKADKYDSYIFWDIGIEGHSELNTTAIAGLNAE